VADTSRIEELRRRVQRDPASIAFAQLAEEYRRAGRYKEAIETCEHGLAHHPGYLSARVTLGRSFLETNELEAAQLELRQVLRAAPENLAALRGLAEIHHRRGELQEALAHYRTALEFARNDPELQHLVEQIAKDLEPQPAASSVEDGLSFEDVKNTFLNLSLPGDDGDAGAGAGAGAGVPVEQASPDAVVIETAVSSPTPEEAFAWPTPDEPEPALDTAPSIVDPALDAPFPGLVAVEPATVVEQGATESVLQEPDALEAAAAAPAPLEDEPAASLPEPLPVGDVAASTSIGTAGEEAAPRAATADPQVDALERWLETIIADRQRRT
jgi:hypothetical protein